MSCLSDLMQTCPNGQADLNQFFNTCAQGAMEPMPFYEWLASDVNQNNLQQVISPGNGKVRKMNLVYQKRILESEVDANQNNPNCSATTKRGQCVAEYEIDTTANVQAEESIAATDLAAICVDNPQYFQSVLNRLIDAVDRKNATKSVTEAVALYGKWADDVTVTNDELVVKTLKDSDPLTLQPFTMEDIDMALQKTGFCAPVFIGGDEHLAKYYRRLQAGCCAASGVNLGEIMAQYGKAVFYDRRIVTALGATKSIVVQNGALALLTYTLAPWKNGVANWVTNGGNYFSGVVVSPRTGVPMDLFVKDDCGVVSITVTATTKVVGMPTDMFAAGDVYEGVTFVNKIKVTNA